MIDDKTLQIGRLLSIADACWAIFIYIWVFNFWAYFSPDSNPDMLAHFAVLPLLVSCLVWGMSYAGAYRTLRISIWGHVWIVASGLAFALGALFTVLFLLQLEFMSRFIVGAFTVLSFSIIMLMRAFFVWWYFRRASQRRINAQRVLIVGTGDRANKIAELIEQYSEWGTIVVGYLDVDPQRVGQDLGRGKVLGLIDDINDVLKVNVVDEVIVAVPRSLIGSLAKIFAACEEEGVTVKLMADLFDLKVAQMRLTVLGNSPLLSFEPVAQDEIGLLVKRLFDLTAVLCAMPVVLPLMLLVGLAVKLDSPGPVFFVQQRVGLRKRIFPMFKFRSMHVNAEAMLKEIEHLNEADGPNFKIANDPRVTRVGSFIRKTSLDELPQLINVFLGHMSLVGPRPMSLRDVDLFDRGVQRKRFSVRPGLTCLWQVSGRSNLSFDKWLELDLTYIETWSFRLDMEILLRTVPVVLRGSGAV